MTLAASISRLLMNDSLTEALELARGHLKTTPSDKDARHLYIDLLIVAGDYERADAQCSLAVTFSPEDTMGFALLRNQLRAMSAREAWFKTGAVPAFPGGPSETDKAAMRLALAHGPATREEAAAALSTVEEARGQRPMQWNGKPVSDLRDLDDRTPHALEVIMTGGAYLWVDFAKISAVTMEPIARPRDLAFRRAELCLTDGATAPVLLPAIYQGTADSPNLLLGHETEWVEEASGITTGRGQRCFLAGDEMVSFHDLQSLAAAEGSIRKAVNG